MFLCTLVDGLALAGYAAAMEMRCMGHSEQERLAYGFDGWAEQLIYFVEVSFKSEALEKAHAFMDRSFTMMDIRWINTWPGDWNLYRGPQDCPSNVASVERGPSGYRWLLRINPYASWQDADTLENAMAAAETALKSYHVLGK